VIRVPQPVEKARGRGAVLRRAIGAARRASSRPAQGGDRTDFSQQTVLCGGCVELVKADSVLWWRPATDTRDGVLRMPA